MATDYSTMSDEALLSRIQAKKSPSSDATTDYSSMSDEALLNKIMAKKESSLGTESRVNATDKSHSFLDSVKQQAGDFGNAVVHHLANAPLGLTQLAAHSAETVGQKLAPDSGFAKGAHQFSQATDQALKDIEQDYQANTPDNIGSYAGAAAGEVLPFLAGGGLLKALGLAGKAGEIASKVPSAVKFLGENALSGALTSSVQPVHDTSNFASAKANQAGFGALTGLGAAAGGNALSRLISPKASLNPNVQLLLDNKVTPTPGQMLGGGWQSNEDKLTSLPILGDVIQGARARGQKEFNRAAYQRVLDPIEGKPPSGLGHEGIKELSNQLSDKYDALIPQLSFKADAPFVDELTRLHAMTNHLPAAQTQQFESILRHDVVGKLSPQGSASGETVKQIQSELSRLAADYGKDPSANMRHLGQAVGELKHSVHGVLERTNPAQAKELNAINQAYANFVRLRSAAGMQGAKEGIFTPNQLSAAVKNQDKSVGKGDFAKGQALMQDLSKAGKSVLGSTYPDSGTSGRNLLAALAAGVGGVYAPHVSTAAALVTGAASLPYLPGLNKLTAMLLARRPAGAGKLADQIQRLTPLVSAVSGAKTGQSY